MTNSVTVLERIGNEVNSLYGAPVWVLVIALSICLGYLLKIAKWFPNQRIPLVVVPTAIVANLLLMLPFKASSMVTSWVTRQIIVGLVLGFVAWVFHYTILKRVESYFPWLQGAMQDAGLDSAPPFKVDGQSDPVLTKTGDTGNTGATDVNKP